MSLDFSHVPLLGKYGASKMCFLSMRQTKYLVTKKPSPHLGVHKHKVIASQYFAIFSKDVCATHRNNSTSANYEASSCFVSLLVNIPLFEVVDIYNEKVRN